PLRYYPFRRPFYRQSQPCPPARCSDKPHMSRRRLPQSRLSFSLSLHDALPILEGQRGAPQRAGARRVAGGLGDLPQATQRIGHRSEEHTSELQSRENLVCRLLLDKKNRPVPATGGHCSAIRTIELVAQRLVRLR